MADTRGTQRYVGFFSSWLCFLAADWLGRQIPITWVRLCLYALASLCRSTRKFFCQRRYTKRYQFSVNKVQSLRPAVIFAVRRVNQPFEMSAPLINVTFTCPSTFKALSFKTLVASCPFTKPFCFYSNDTQYNICSIARLGDKKVTISGLRHSSPLEVFTKSGRN